MFSLTFLGTGGGLPMDDRFHSSILLETPTGRRYLLDAGEPCSQRLKALGVAFDSIDAVLLSHGHSDHTGGLPMFLQGAWLEPRTRPLPIFLPGELIAPLRAWLEASYLPDKLLGFPVEWHAWETDAPATLADGLRVHVNPTTHLNGLRRLIDPKATHRFKPYSLDLAWPGPGNACRLVYSADLGRPEDLDALLGGGQATDVLICELAHFTPAALFAYLADKTVNVLLLNHLTAESGAHSGEITAQAVRDLPRVREVRVMRDGERVEF